VTLSTAKILQLCLSEFFGSILETFLILESNQFLISQPCESFATAQTLPRPGFSNINLLTASQNRYQQLHFISSQILQTHLTALNRRTATESEVKILQAFININIVATCMHNLPFP